MGQLLRIVSCTLVLFLLCGLLVQAQQQQLQNKRRKQQQQLQQQQQTGNLGGPFNGGNKRKPAAQAVQNLPNKNKKNKRPATTVAPANDITKDKEKNFIYVTKPIPDLGKVKGRTYRTLWSGKTFIHFVDIPYAQPPKRFKVRFQ